MQVHGSVFELGMAQQYLNRAQIGAGFEQVCGIAVPRPGLCRVFQNRLVQGPQNAGLLAHEPFNMRHSPEAWDQSCLRKASNSSSG